MPKPRPSRAFLSQDDRTFPVKPRKTVPYQFVLDAVAELPIRTRPMFGCLAVYVQEKIMLILRDKPDERADNGVWLATTEQHHESLSREFPSMRSIHILGKGITGWQVIPADRPDFEEAALRVCELVIARDPRIGKVPKARRSSKAETVENSAKPARTSEKSAKGRVRSS
jgi:hypothetical protein